MPKTEPRSLIRMLADTDPAEAAHRIIELQDERDRLREALEQISTAKRSAGGLRLMAADALDAKEQQHG